MTYEEQWREVADDLGIHIFAPFVLTLPSGTTLKAEVLVEKIGGPKGMLIFSDDGPAAEHGDEMVADGYGFTSYLPPEPSEENEYDRDQFIDMLSEWTWCGPKESKPQWFR